MPQIRLPKGRMKSRIPPVIIFPTVDPPAETDFYVDSYENPY